MKIKKHKRERSRVKKKKQLSILYQILIAIVAAVIVGILFPQSGKYIKPWGDIVLRLITMIIVPLIFFSIAKAVVDIKDFSKAAKLGIFSFLLFCLTTCIGSTLAVVIAVPMFDWVKLPKAALLQANNIDQIVSHSSGYGGFWSAIFRIIPNNLLAAFVEGQTLPVIFFAVIVGFLILKMMGKKEHSLYGKYLEKFVGSFATLIYKFIDIVVAMMPIAVFAYLTWMISMRDMELIYALSRMLMIALLILLTQIFVTYGFLISICKLNFLTYLRKILPVQLFAFTTASSAATIPINIRFLTQKLGVSRTTCGFVVPFGATINMDGTAICQVVYAIFIAHLYGIHLEPISYVTLAVMSSVVSIGVASVPSASLVTLGVVLGIVGIPIEGIGFILATDRLLDMARTAVNVTGDAAVSVVMDKSQGRLKKDLYNKKI